MSAFVAATDMAEVFAAMSRAMSSAAGSTSSAGSARDISPISAASAPLISRPVSMTSSAWDAPISRGTSQVEPASATMPRRGKTNPYLPSAAAILISQDIGIVMPMPTAEPFIAAITGVRICHAGTDGRSRLAASRSPPSPRCPLKVLAPPLRSAPAEKYFPAPVTTIARTASSASNASSAACSSWSISRENAFRCSGRLSQIVATPSSTFVKIAVWSGIQLSSLSAGKVCQGTRCHQPPHVLDDGINDAVGLAPGLGRGHFTGSLADDGGQDRGIQAVERRVGQAQQCVILTDPLMPAAPLDELEAGWPVASEEQQRQVTTLPATFQEGTRADAEQLSSIGHAREPRCRDRLAGGLLVSCLMFLEQRDEDLALPAEVVIQAPDARSGAIHDVGDARVREALLGKELAGGVEQGALGLGGATPLPRAAERSASRWPGHLPQPHNPPERLLAIPGSGCVSPTADSRNDSRTRFYAAPRSSPVVHRSVPQPGVG